MTPHFLGIAVNLIFDSRITLHVLYTVRVSVIYNGTWNVLGAVSNSSVIEKYDAIEHYRRYNTIPDCKGELLALMAEPHSVKPR